MLFGKKRPSIWLRRFGRLPSCRRIFGTPKVVATYVNIHVIDKHLYISCPGRIVWPQVLQICTSQTEKFSRCTLIFYFSPIQYWKTCRKFCQTVSDRSKIMEKFSQLAKENGHVLLPGQLWKWEKYLFSYYERWQTWTRNLYLPRSSELSNVDSALSASPVCKTSLILPPTLKFCPWNP